LHLLCYHGLLNYPCRFRCTVARHTFFYYYITSITKTFRILHSARSLRCGKLTCTVKHVEDIGSNIRDCVITPLSKNSLLGRLLGLVQQYKFLISSNRAALDQLADKWDIVLLGGILGSIFSFLQFLVSPYIGKLSDQIGRRKTLLLTMVTIVGILAIE
jgi:hypothetical protein